MSKLSQTLASEAAQQDFDKRTSLSEETREDIYLMGYNFYQNGKYNEATGCFSLLVLSDSKLPKYWMGLAASQQMNKKFQEALTSYAFAAELDKADPRPLFHTAECHYALRSTTEALDALNTAEKLANAKSDEQDLLSRILVLRKGWSEKK